MCGPHLRLRLGQACLHNSDVAHGFSLESAVDRVRRSVDGNRLGDRRRGHGDHHHRDSWARAAFNIASYTLLPFGRKAVSRAEYSGRHDLGTGPFGLIGNLIWLVLAGWWLALGHLLTAMVLAVTIIGIPFALAHLKLAGIALWPIGKEIVPADAVPFFRSTAERYPAGEGISRFS